MSESSVNKTEDEQILPKRENLPSDLAELQQSSAKLEVKLKRLQIENQNLIRDKNLATENLRLKVENAENRQRELQKQKAHHIQLARSTPSMELAHYHARVLDLQQQLKKKMDQIQEQEKEIKSLQNVVEDHQVLTDELEKIHENHLQQTEIFAKTMLSLNEKHQETKDRMLNDLRDTTNDIQINALKNSKGRLNKVSRDLLDKNSSQKQQLKSLTEKISTLKEDNRLLRLQLREAQGEAHGQMKHSQTTATTKHTLSSQHAELKAEEASLSAELERIKTNYNKTRQALLSRADLEIEIVQAETMNVRHILNVQIEESNRIKLLCQTILNKRPAIEQVLIDALKEKAPSKERSPKRRQREFANDQNEQTSENPTPLLEQYLKAVEDEKTREQQQNSSEDSDGSDDELTTEAVLRREKPQAQFLRKGQSSGSSSTGSNLPNQFYLFRKKHEQMVESQAHMMANPHATFNEELSVISPANPDKSPSDHDMNSAGSGRVGTPQSCELRKHKTLVGGRNDDFLFAFLNEREGVRPLRKTPSEMYWREGEDRSERERAREEDRVENVDEVSELENVNTLFEGEHAHNTFSESQRTPQHNPPNNPTRSIYEIDSRRLSWIERESILNDMFARVNDDQLAS
ncbi:hypothetical protein BLNAU_12260 [Blattamonas nauphoetae]|uniref:Lebercilin domain-containing protein n=1 Tax=Blattamonas nauphoetae TaxID=2049346 RepID=A0ABQ9XK41_9EUKA|nr:hypothetical protein BLNAU_12260 [Blattamonas nauphoetae]